MPRPLPTELLDQILTDEDLDQVTLARCCCLSRARLDYFRSRLYSLVEIRFSLTEEDMGMGDTDFIYDRQSAALLVALGRYPQLGALVRSTVFLTEGVEDSNIYTTKRQAVRGVLDACPNLQGLACPPYGEREIYDVLDRVQEERKFCLLDLGYPDNDMWDRLAMQRHDLEHLVFSNDDAAWRADPPDDGQADGLQLQSLTFLSASKGRTRDPAFFRALTADSHNSLIRLRMPFTPGVVADFSIFPNLAQLELRTTPQADISAVLASIRTARNLTHLGLPTSLSPQDRTALFASGGLSAALPSTLKSLTLPHNVGPEDVLAVVEQVDRERARLPDLCRIEFHGQRGHPENMFGPAVPTPDYSVAVRAGWEKGIRVVQTSKLPRRTYEYMHI
ncbi:hypothetical protein JCM8097_001023 [Rhodosporidiobolus ruineniae]